MSHEEQNQIAGLERLIIELKSQIGRMDERQEEMILDIKMIKKAVYDPNGYYLQFNNFIKNLTIVC